MELVSREEQLVNSKKKNRKKKAQDLYRQQRKEAEELFTDTSNRLAPPGS